MFSSYNTNSDIVFTVYKDIRTVFRLRDIAMLINETDFKSLNKKLNYYVRTGRLGNPRKGIYTKPGFSTEELACMLYTPCYLSLEYVLQKAGIIFQYGTVISVVSYLSRSIHIEDRTFNIRKLKGELLINTSGIVRRDDHINIATPERAFLDLLYLDTEYYFDNLNPLNKQFVSELLPLYKSKALNSRVKKIIQYG